MRYLVAVSGGIDSVVLLDMLARENRHELIVAHFDHGIRPDSEDDARFVEGLAHAYHLPFVTTRETLGPKASEEHARSRRYAFLRQQAHKHHAMLATAHHADDIIETIAINTMRGTGWRGVAVLNAADIVRPLLSVSKDAIRTYALAKRLEWVEDSTNGSDRYLRNRVRKRIATHRDADKEKALLDTWQHQIHLKATIDDEAKRYLSDNDHYPRHFFIQTDSSVAIEILRMISKHHGGVGLTRPQLERMLLAIKTARPHTLFATGTISLRFSTHRFVVYTS